MWLFIIGVIFVVVAVVVVGVVGVYVRNCKKEGKKPFEEELELEVKNEGNKNNKDDKRSR